MGERIALLLGINGASCLIPWNYRTGFIRFFYETIKVSDERLACWLHDQGFRRGKRTYRLFVFSDLLPISFTASAEGLVIREGAIWELASLDLRLIEKFIEGLEKSSNGVEIRGLKFKLLDIIRKPHPSFRSGFSFRTLSPVLTSTFDPEKSRHPIYLPPDLPEFVRNLEDNLIAKWEAFSGKPWEGERPTIRLWEPKSKLVPVFNIRIKAWHLRGYIKAPLELLETAYYAGMGEKNSQGFGMVEVEEC